MASNAKIKDSNLEGDMAELGVYQGEIQRKSFI